MILKTKNLTKKFGELIAVNNVSVEVKEGSFSVLFGPNGAGKTTWINVVTGYLKKDGGEVWFDGKDITNLSAAETYRLGLARSFQIPRIFPSLTVLENILIARSENPGESFLRAPIKPLWKEAEEKIVREAFSVLKMIGLEDKWDMLGGELSGGDAKLLDVGKAIMSGAKMLLIDEPIAGVNPSLAHTILDRLRKIKEEYGFTILIVEHRLDIALEYVDYAYAMANGRIIAEGKPYDVIQTPEVVESYLGEKYRYRLG
ncbi:MAG TPA: ABC transporter ATP-binding protein [Candidatus Korarchaeota archaeon]|nr:MAG: ABC transporter ATP-binding protein [Candidatus Korarchaeota archaeon]HDD68990.1 ABC transporter ATP-binding protein [Candidatus Korarchaeota archaeon]